MTSYRLLIYDSELLYEVNLIKLITDLSKAHARWVQGVKHLI